jgi:DNA-binding response OmpR family regulator
VRAKILWIEGKRAEGPSFILNLRKKGYAVETFSTGNAALKHILEYGPDLVVVNAATLRTNGKRICSSIREQMNGLPIVLITNPEGPNSENICANVVLKLPFTSRKLLNRIIKLIPTESQKLLVAGPIHLDMELKKVRCLDREGQLTPRLAGLLKILMQNPGTVLERERLFREIWNTEYTGDTRTLDVHISWLRRVIEENPREPQYLKTVRGVGYRLDV